MGRWLSRTVQPARPTGGLSRPRLCGLKPIPVHGRHLHRAHLPSIFRAPSKGLVMCPGIRRGIGRGHRPQSMICPRGRAHQKLEPGTLQVWQVRQMVRKVALLAHALLRPGLHVGRMPQGRAQNDHAALSLALVTSPHGLAKLCNAWPGGARCSGDCSSFAQVRRNSAVGGDGP